MTCTGGRLACLLKWIVFSPSPVMSAVLASIDMRKVIIVASILSLLVLLLLPIGYQAVWDGRFELTIFVDANRPIDESSLLFATCWHEREAVHAVQNPSVYEYGFRSPRTTESGQLRIDVPCSGRDGAYGFGSTYNHPKFLVVEYRDIDDNQGQPSRKRFAIPEGRGLRTMTIKTP